MIRLTTLCYLEKEGHYLMLHRVSKKEDVNAGKWIGIGGKFEPGEAPEDCMRRETLEETGFRLESCRFRGIITFIYDHKDPEYIFTYTSDRFETGPGVSFTGKPAGDFHPADNVNDTPALPVPVCDEGIFRWVPKAEVLDLELWEGDRYLLQYLLEDRAKPFSLKLCYDAEDNLTEAWELSEGYLRLK